MEEKRRFYLAPMEGVTGYVYRNAYAKYFGNIDKYYTPFISPGEHKHFKSRELRDVLPENNAGLKVAVQMLTNNAGHFIVTARRMKEFGYSEVNLNLGCPSGTVVSKGKGSGFLAYPEKLDEFLYSVYNGLANEGLDISIKTRLGRDDADEFYRLLEIYNKYPVSELVIHPRVQKDMYKNKPRMELFEYALDNSRNPVVYNGDIFTVEDYRKFADKYRNQDTLMLGRGIIANPGLVDCIFTGKPPEKEKLRAFYDELVKGYLEEIQGERNVMFKLKEIMFYMVNIFTDRDAYWKKLKKADSLMELDAIVHRMLAEGELSSDRGYAAL